SQPNRPAVELSRTASGSTDAATRSPVLIEHRNSWQELLGHVEPAIRTHLGIEYAGQRVFTIEGSDSEGLLQRPWLGADLGDRGRRKETGAANHQQSSIPKSSV